MYHLFGLLETWQYEFEPGFATEQELSDAEKEQQYCAKKVVESQNHRYRLALCCVSVSIEKNP